MHTLKYLERAKFGMIVTKNIKSKKGGTKTKVKILEGLKSKWLIFIEIKNIFILKN